MNRCHCMGCHRTFNSVGAFDKHRKGGECSEPLICGMVCVDGIWRGELDVAYSEYIAKFAEPGR